MSDLPLIIQERKAQIAPGVEVARLLPYHKKRMVAAFCFIDRGGPAEVDFKSSGIGQHPHIGISTLTYLLEGSQLHTDSLGSHQRLTAGAVNWMTAGRGIVHNESSDPEAASPMRFHAYQIWVALPKGMEDIEPSFFHCPKEKLPLWSQDGGDFALVAGEVAGFQSPVPVHSKLYMLDISYTAAGQLNTEQLYGEFAVCPVQGSVDYDGQSIGLDSMLVIESPENKVIDVAAGSRLLIFGGEPFAERRYMDWNFVSTDKEALQQASQAWQNREFKLIPGDNSYVPYPTKD